MKMRWILFFCILPLFGLLAESFEASTLYLTWKKNPCTTMTIQWLSKSEDHNESSIRYRDYANSQWKIEQGKRYPLPGFGYDLNQVELQGLEPHTLYVFRIGLESDEFKFVTMPCDLTQPIHFVVGGDMQHDDAQFMDITSQQAAKTDPYFAVIGGDIAYAYSNQNDPGQPKKWITWIQSWHKNMKTPEGRLIPVIAAIGNHDLFGGFNKTPEQAKIFSTLFPMPGEQIYNVLDFGTYLSIFLLDSGHANPIEGKQTEWLRNALKVREGIPHKFPIYHVPIYSSIKLNRDPGALIMRENWVPLFEIAGIKVAFENHDHAYKRTFPLLQDKIDKKGVIYLGDGSWGVEKTRVPKWRRKPYYLDQYASKRQFILVILEEGKEHFFAIDDKGQKIDELHLEFSHQ